MARALRDQGIVTSQFVIKHPEKGTQNLGDFPHMLGDLSPTKKQLFEYLNTCDPDAVVIIETPFNFEFFRELSARKCAVILIPMIDSIAKEKFEPYKQYISKIIHPTQIGLALYRNAEHWGIPIEHIPWPIDTDYFNPENLTETHQKHFSTFIHNEGFGGAGYRKGTDMVLTAFQQLSYRMKNITLHVRSQCGESRHSQVRKDIKRATVDLSDLDEAIEVYRNGLVYIAPSRREGLGLPIPEAMACGLPVITAGAPPMHQWFPQDRRLLVAIQRQSSLPYGDIPMYDCSVLDLMQKMKFAAENLDIMRQIGEQNRKIAEENFSWHVLRAKWRRAIEKI